MMKMRTRTNSRRRSTVLRRLHFFFGIVLPAFIGMIITTTTRRTKQQPLQMRLLLLIDAFRIDYVRTTRTRTASSPSWLSSSSLSSSTAFILHHTPQQHRISSSSSSSGVERRRETRRSKHRTLLSASSITNPTISPSTLLTVKENVGSGSYGTVHLLQVDDNDDDDNNNNVFIGKRAWDIEELQQQYPNLSQEQLKDKAERCRTYFDVEVHCFTKLQLQQQEEEKPKTSSSCLPYFLGVRELMISSPSDEKKYDNWMVFEYIENGQCMDDLFKQEHNKHTTRNSITTTTTTTTNEGSSNKKSGIIYPYIIDALGGFDDNDDDAAAAAAADDESDDNDNDNEEFTKCLDVIFTDLLRSLVHIHKYNIVHRDIKPGNFLIVPRRGSTTNNKNGDEKESCSQSSSRLVLLDFGSAADLDTAGLLFKENVGISGERVAISPIYTAPEIFIDPSYPDEALTFDCFSAALLYCQLLFQFTDERTDAGFHQQLIAADWNLDTWLQAEMQGKVVPIGLDDALLVLQKRPGLWRLLQDMLTSNPSNRISSMEALERWESIQQGVVDAKFDGAFLMDVLESLDTCIVPPEPSTLFDDELSATMLISRQRPLHFVASFQRNNPLGLVLAESSESWDYDEEEEDDEDDSIRRQNQQLWEQASSNALPGEVFVKGIVKGGQADRMGVFLVGDRLQGVGELPLSEGGFEKAVTLLQDQPKSSKYVTLHFDRKSALQKSTVSEEETSLPLPIIDAPIQAKDQGAWSSTGRRKAQEDAFILQELHDTKQRSVLLAGVMDGHLGKAASQFVHDNLPEMFLNELMRSDKEEPSEELLERTWNDVCDMYRSQCSPDSCSAEYDPREGILEAFTGSDDTVAGTTATILALDMQTSHLAFLNCGDSRGIVLNAQGKVQFQTIDHTPGSEVERFKEGRHAGLDYCLPECRFSKWRVAVGDYNYAVSRSLEGAFATSRGIVSTPDVSLISAEPDTTVVVASDGFWEVIDVEEASRIMYRLRQQQAMNAADAAKALCSLALEKGSSDNVSVVVLYL